MELNKIREMSELELNAELIRMKKDLFNLRFQHVTGQLENPIKVRETKRDIARIKTIIREKELAKSVNLTPAITKLLASVACFGRPAFNL